MKEQIFRDGLNQIAHLGLLAFHDGDAAISGAQIDANNRSTDFVRPESEGKFQERKEGSLQGILKHNENIKIANNYMFGLCTVKTRFSDPEA